MEFPLSLGTSLNGGSTVHIFVNSNLFKVPKKSLSGCSKTLTSLFVGVQRINNLQVILLLGQEGSFLAEPENNIKKGKEKEK